jgi:hypothetical protein
LIFLKFDQKLNILRNIKDNIFPESEQLLNYRIKGYLFFSMGKIVLSKDQLNCNEVLFEGNVSQSDH